MSVFDVFGGGHMEKRTRLLISVGCAFVAVLACILLVGHVHAEDERERSEALKRYGGEMVSLVVSLHGIEAGETITSADVEQRDWIASLAPEGAILSVDEVVGKTAGIPIVANAPLCEINLRSASDSVDIPSGHVAVSVPLTDKLGISTVIDVGAHVVAYRVMEQTAEAICGDAVVLESPTVANASLGQGTITIAVPASDVPRILTASTLGDLRLVVPADDVRQTSVTQKRVTDVLPQENGSERAAEAAAQTESLEGGHDERGE